MKRWIALLAMLCLCVGAACAQAAAPAEGWAFEGGEWYYYENGVRATGWVNTAQDGSEGGQWYYLDPKTGALEINLQGIVRGSGRPHGQWRYLPANWGGTQADGGWYWDDSFSGWIYLALGGGAASESWFYVGGDSGMLRGK